MKLISCHIENYGKISDKDFSFNCGLNSYLLDNGEGKSTLASFLRAMFYGMKTTRSGSAQLGEREHYSPFSGDGYGGNLKLEYEGDTYTIERTFGRKSGTEDTLEVYDGNNRLLPDIENPGNYFFGIDERSFVRSVFIGSEIEDGNVGDDIKSKLGNLINGTTQTNNYETADKLLDFKMKKFRPQRGSSGKINEINFKIAELKEDLANLKSTYNSLPQLYNQKKETEKEISEINSKIEKIKSAELIKEKRRNYNNCKRDFEETGNEIKKITDRFGGNVPTEEIIRNLTDIDDSITELKNRADRLKPDEDELSCYKKYSEIFSEGVPGEKDISDMIDMSEKLTKLKNINYGFTEDADNLSYHFGNGVPTAEETEEMRSVISEYTDTGRKTNPPHKKRAYALYMSFALSLVLLVSGIAATPAVFSLGLSLCVAGAVILAVTVVLFLRSYVVSVHSDNDIRYDLRNRICGFLLKYRYDTSDVTSLVQTLCKLINDADRYNKMIAANAEAERKKEDTDAEIAQLTENISAFLKKYENDSPNYGTALNNLRSSAENFIKIKNKLEQNEKTIKANEEEILNANKEKAEILSHYNISADSYVCDNGYGELRNIIIRYKNYKDRIKKLSDDMTVISDKIPDESYDGEISDCDITELENRKESLQKELADLNRQIDCDELSSERIPDVESEIEKNNNLLEKYNKKYELLKKARQCLEEAEKSLSDRLLEPMKNSFLEYMRTSSPELAEEMTINPDYEILFTRNGKSRRFGHLSTGEQTICSLALRLALIDNMYGDKSPFIVMDDPFVSLDATHLNLAASLMRTVAERKQILYFSCHVSRKI